MTVSLLRTFALIVSVSAKFDETLADICLNFLSASPRCIMLQNCARSKDTCCFSCTALANALRKGADILSGGERIYQTSNEESKHDAIFPCAHCIFLFFTSHNEFYSSQSPSRWSTWGFTVNKVQFNRLSILSPEERPGSSALVLRI